MLAPLISSSVPPDRATARPASSPAVASPAMILDLLGALDQAQSLHPAARVGPVDPRQHGGEAALAAARESGPLEAEARGRQPSFGEDARQERLPLGVEAPTGRRAL